MENITIIVPVYNGEETIRQCLDAILRIDYPSEFIELLVVDDGSTDGTLDIVSAMKTERIRVIRNERNRGRAYTRFRGASEAEYDNLLFIDSRVIVDRDIINAVCSNDEPVQIPKVVTGIGNRWDAALGAIRRMVFRNAERYSHVDRDNFDELPKGTTSLFILKDIFLSACRKIDYESRYVNEDTGLLLHVVEEGHRIFRNPGLKITYLQRSGLWDNIVHLFERGPRFVDHYYGRHRKFTLLLRLLLFILIALPVTVIVCPTFLVYLLSIMFLSDILFSVTAGRSGGERMSLFLLLPVILFAFSCGVLKGLLVRQNK